VGICLNLLGVVRYIVMIVKMRGGIMFKMETREDNNIVYTDEIQDILFECVKRIGDLEDELKTLQTKLNYCFREV